MQEKFATNAADVISSQSATIELCYRCVIYITCIMSVTFIALHTLHALCCMKILFSTGAGVGGFHWTDCQRHEA